MVATKDWSTWFRSIQQTYAFHVVKSAAWAGVTAGVTGYFGGHPETALAVGAATFFGTLESALEHAPGSASFVDGAENKTVTNAVTLANAAKTDSVVAAAALAVQDTAKAQTLAAGLPAK